MLVVYTHKCGSPYFVVRVLSNNELLLRGRGVWKWVGGENDPWRDGLHLVPTVSPRRYHGDCGTCSLGLDWSQAGIVFKSSPRTKVINSQHTLSPVTYGILMQYSIAYPYLHPLLLYSHHQSITTPQRHMLKDRLHWRPLQIYITQGQSSLVLHFSFPSHLLEHLFIILSLHYGPCYEVDGMHGWNCSPPKNCFSF